ncbi:hypothetical protein APHAL10511_003167 [Amanita phalloides]|nr:hypothetical protein APHAL10511_003167 [Amanita phalloides]
MPRPRASAFDVSFPDEAPLEPRAPSVSSSSSGVNKRRRYSESSVERPAKQKQLPPTSFYVSRPEEEKEVKELVVPGEEPEEDPLDDDEKPIRILTDFSIFDPLHRNEMISLAAIEEEDGVDRHFEGAGWTTAYYVDEDVGQDDWETEEEEKVYIRLGAILRYMVDYKSEYEPFYIETECAWYILKTPSKAYEPTYKMFYTPRRVVQMVVSAALRRPGYTYDSFIKRYSNMVDIFGRTCQEEDISDAVEELQNIVNEMTDSPQLKSTPIVRHILRKASPISVSVRHRANELQPRIRQPQHNRALLGNPDLAVLKPENQNVTHVTPRIAELIQGFVREEIYVIGARPPLPDKKQIEVLEQNAYARLCSLIRRAHTTKKSIDWNKEDRLVPGSDYVRSMNIDDQKYHVGDFVLVPISDNHKPPENLPAEGNVPKATKIQDYFWFGKIIYFISQEHTAHVQWLEHGSQFFLDEMAHPQELFLNDICGLIPLEQIVSRVIVHERPEHPPANQNEYFYKFKHDKETASLVSIDTQRSQMVANHLPPENCPVCVLSEERKHAEQPRKLRTDDGRSGIAYRGRNFHPWDFVLFKAQQGPANIGYIIEINIFTAKVRQVGRISALGDVLPDNIMRDERHLYLCKDEMKVPTDDLIQVIYVFPYESIPDLNKWLDASPDHFFLKYAFPSIKVDSWHDRQLVDCDELQVCSTCCKEKLSDQKLLKQYLSIVERQSITVLDLFGGAGAFSLGMKDGFSGLKITHAVEVSPSAARTFRRNSPDTIVYNQCANIILRYAIKKRSGHLVEVPKQLDGGHAVPDPPKKGDIQMITAGFPCQSHSGLNMFKLADDPKTNLIFNALSYMDEYRPQMGYFENVPGFVHYPLNPIQASVHRLEGGIPMGGLKILVRALVDLGYQVRFGLLQAGHCGTPQRRIRFFLIAALDGHPLPELPQPTHDFPYQGHLRINLKNGESIECIKVQSGAAPHPFVTIDDAIEDLPQFDWKHPRSQSLSPEKRAALLERERSIPAFVCDDKSARCGYTQRRPNYHHEPRTRFQAVARRKPTADLQQFTKCLQPKRVERVVSIPLKPNADYRSLEPHLQEWQTANPTSWVARNNYRSRLYGRLDGKSYFPTTVTNVDPTAKQSKVLHPHCHRMVSVRELARSQGFPDHFVFEAIGGNVITMHRQIGNAVPFTVAAALGRELRQAMFKKWLEDRNSAQEDVIMDED